jgi:alanine dehydrogenase
MVIGVPTEVKDHESRVGLVPSGVEPLVSSGHRVLVQSGAGAKSGLRDDDYLEFGAGIAGSPAEVWNEADLIVKVKEPQPAEYGFLRPGLTSTAFFVPGSRCSPICTSHRFPNSRKSC